MARRLAAILAADVAGYSRLMSADEAGTLAALQAHRSELIAPTIERHGGRIVKLIGDGILVEFNSVVEAVECAAQIQRDMEVRNRALADDRRLLLRMGVHLGDIIIDGDDIYGDGVNIAARLQAAAETGGICISRQAFDQVDGKLPLNYRPLGAQILKNIPKPVEIYAIELNGAAARTKGADIKLKVKYCRAPDGVRLAYASAGSGPPLVKTANRMNHVALATLIRAGWDEDTPVFRQLFSSLFMPGGTQEQLQKFAERQRKTTMAECAYRYFETIRSLDVSDLLPKVSVPTLVMHKRDDQVQPFDAGRELAAGIPGARFVALPGQNHIPLEQDAETERMLEEIKLFVKR